MALRVRAHLMPLFVECAKDTPVASCIGGAIAIDEKRCFDARSVQLRREDPSSISRTIVEGQGDEAFPDTIAERVRT